MTHDVNTIQRFIPKVSKTNQKPGVVKSNDNIKTSTFSEIFKKNLKKDIVLSSHAQERIKQDGININNKEMEKIGQALKKLDEKGAKESLLISRDYAMIASVHNKTIITAMSGERLKENVWTNIDSAMLI